jgi:hypothetical protein
VQAGGGLLFTMGDKVRFEQANERFGDLLPHALRDLHLAADPAAGTPPLGIEGVDWQHPIVQSLGAQLEESLHASRTSRYFNLDVGADRKARAILRFDNGAPALVEGRRDAKGRTILLTTSLDLDFSDLALRSTFPALLQRTVRYLAKAVESTGGGTIRQGGSAELMAPTGATALALTAPSGKRLVAEGGDGGARARFGPLDEVGMYRAEVGRGAAFTRDARLDVSVGPSLDESDFLPVRPTQVAAALGKEGEPGVEVAFGAGASGDPFQIRGFASYLLLGLCLLFVGESLLASRG